MLKVFHRLRVSQKLALISIFFMIPDTVLLCLFLFSINSNIEFARMEKLGNEYQEPLERLLELLPQHAKAGVPSRLTAEIDQAVEDLQIVDARIGAELQFTAEGLSKRHREHCTVANLAAEWSNLKNAQTNVPEALLHLISDVRTMITHAGDSSNLILDPDLDSYYLMDVTLLALPEMQDRLWTSASYGRDALQRGPLSNHQNNQLAINAALLAMADLARVARSSETALNEDPNFYGVSPTLKTRLSPALASFTQKAELFIQTTRELSEGEAKPISPDEYCAQGMAAHAASFKLWHIAKDELNLLLDTRMDHYRGRRDRSLVLTACALIAAICLVTFITRSISGPLQRQAHNLRESNRALEEEIAERQRAEAALKNAEHKYRSIFENSVEGIFQTTPDGRYMVANPALARIYGYDSPEELQKSLTDIGSRLYVDPNRRSAFRRHIAENGAVYRFESEIFHKNGSRIWISENARGVYDASGTLTYYEGTVEDISVRKQTEAALEKARKEVLAATRLAGMAEVATGILHNVGNVLNSVNVSAICITDSVCKSKMQNLGKVAKLLHENSHRLGEYLTVDEKGSRLPRYIADLAEHLAFEQTALIADLEELKTHLDHVKEVVAMQQSYAKVGGVVEPVSITELVEDALRLNAIGLAQHNVQVVREIDPASSALVDKHKLLQILVNLVRNAEHACAQSRKEAKQIHIHASLSGELVRLAIQDNGVGIAAENMVSIFKHGFTTKKDGHGFGLHSSALAARELGGSLYAQSDGLERGATFTIELPLKPAKKGYAVNA